MTITAKYPGKCAICGERFHVGAQIHWSKGEPSSHATCAAKFAEQMSLPSPAPQAPQAQSSGGKASAGHVPRQIRSINF